MMGKLTVFLMALYNMKTTIWYRFPKIYQPRGLLAKICRDVNIYAMEKLVILECDMISGEKLQERQSRRDTPGETFKERHSRKNTPRYRKLT